MDLAFRNLDKKYDILHFLITLDNLNLSRGILPYKDN